MKKVLIILGVIVLLLGAGFCMVFQGPSIPETSDYKINLDELRKAAGEPGQADQPLRLNSLLVAEGAFPAKAVLSTRSLSEEIPMTFTSFQVVYPEGKTIIIDTALDKTLLNDNFPDAPFFKEKFNQMQAGLLKAEHIFVTHEHMDHIGGISKSPHLEKLYANSRLLPEQINGPKVDQANFPEGSLAKFKPFTYDRIISPAPGLVLQKAPGHSTGTQLIYLRLQNGKEYLFVGDVAWHMDNIQKLDGRPWLVSAVFLSEDRAQVAHQLRALHDFEKKKTGVHIVVAHDKNRYQKQLADGLYSKEFE